MGVVNYRRLIKNYICSNSIYLLAISEFQKLSLSKREQAQIVSSENEFYLHENKK